jgi:hypothetical protein
MRYRLRTLLIVLALGPPVLAVMWWWVANTVPEFFGFLVVCGAYLGVAYFITRAARRSSESRWR